MLNNRGFKKHHTEAHRVVLVAACPMLQSMEKSSVGSHLEVRLASDIKPEAVYTFLQYLYEGFMMLTEENCKDVEKIARLLQVDSVIKCCADFNKCLSLKTGNANLSEQYRYTFHDMIEFRHVRSSEMQKTVQDKLKRPLSDFHRPGSPSMKRAKHYRTGSPCDISVIADRLSMAQSYATQDRIGNSKVPSSAKFSMGGKTSSYPIEVVEDSIELVQTETDQESDTVKIDEAVSVGISSQINNTSDLQVIDVSKQTQHSTSVDVSQNKKSSPNNSITVSPLDTFPSTSQYTETNVTKDTPPQSMPSPRTHPTPAKPLETAPTPQSKSLDRPPGSMQLQTIPQMSRPPLLTKSFAAGSPLQSTHADGIVQPVYPVSYSSSSTSLQGPPASIRSPVISENPTVFESRKDCGFTEKPDLSIVKVEAADEENTGGLDMYIDTSEGRVMPHNSHRVQDDTSDTEANTTGEWTREEILSEEGNVSGDQSSWMDHSFKGMEGEDGGKQVGESVEIFNEYHSLTRLPGHKRACVYCSMCNLKYRSGWSIKSYYKCQICDVPLCKAPKDCFSRYHDLRLRHPHISPTMLKKTYKEEVKQAMKLRPLIPADIDTHSNTSEKLRPLVPADIDTHSNTSEKCLESMTSRQGYSSHTQLSDETDLTVLEFSHLH